MAGNFRDGTGRYCFDMFGGGKNGNGTGRDGKIMKIIVAWMGRDGTVGGCEFSRRDGTLQYNDLLFHDGTRR